MKMIKAIMALTEHNSDVQQNLMCMLNLITHVGGFYARIKSVSRMDRG